MSGNPDKKPWLLGGALIALTLLAYQPVWQAGFIWDDDVYVADNAHLRSVEGLRKIWTPGVTIQYYPLVFSSFWAEYHLWGAHPLGYHLVNVLLHAVNAILLWQILRQLGLPGAWLAAAIFAIHPVTVESVAWITERKNVLSTFFYLLAALAWLRVRPLTDRRYPPLRPLQGGEAKESERAWDWRFYPLVVAAFLCALWSKTVTCSLPAALLLVVWWKTGRIDKRDVLAMAPLFVLGVALARVTLQMEHNAGAGGAEWSLSFVQRCLVAGRVVWFYAWKLVWPRNLTFIYPRWQIDAGAPWQYAFPLAALAVVADLWLFHRRIGCGPLVAVLFFGGTLVPALGFFDVYPFRYSYVADHFQYLACIGLIVLAVSVAAALCRRISQHGQGIGIYVGVVVLALLGWTTWTQAHVYRDLETLWRDTLAKNPACWMAHNNLSALLIPEGRLKEGLQHSEAALRLKPDFVEACYNSAIALEKMGRTRDAIVRYSEALRSKPADPVIHNNLAWLLATIPTIEGGDAVRAVALAQRACELAGNRTVPYLDTLAVAYAAGGNFKQAIVTIEGAITLARSSGQTQYIEDMTSHLDLFRHGKAYRRSATASASNHS